MSTNELTLADIRNKYQYDKNLRKYSNRHYPNDNSIYGKVDSNKDVERHRNYLVNSLISYKSISPLVQEDIKDIEQAMAKYEIAVRKVIATCDNPNNGFDYQPTELNNLIEDVFLQQKNVNKLLMRKLFQD